MPTSDCTSCKKTKPLSDFYPKIASQNGVSYRCKDCCDKANGINNSQERAARLLTKAPFDVVDNVTVIYVLKLEDDCYYIGMTSDFNRRYTQHLNGIGAKWTALHRPLGVHSLDIVPEGYDARLMENKITKRMMILKGVERIRGGSWCSPDVDYSYVFQV